MILAGQTGNLPAKPHIESGKGEPLFSEPNRIELMVSANLRKRVKCSAYIA